MAEFPKCEDCGHAWHGLPCAQFVGWGDEHGFGNPGDRCRCHSSFKG